MLSFKSPHTLIDAEVAVFHAWEDGFPISGPAGDYRTAEPIATCLASVTISHDPTYSPDSFASWSNINDHNKSSYTITVEGHHGQWIDRLNEKSNHRSPLTPGASNLIVVVRLHNEENGDWSHLQFHYTRIQTDSISSNTIMASSKSFLSQWLEQSHGNTSTKDLPALTPVIHGVVEWVHQGRVIPVLHYDPFSQIWTSTEENYFTDDTGGEHQFAYIGPDATDPSSAHVSYLGAYTTSPSPIPGNAIDTQQIGWEWITAFRIYDHTHLALLGLLVQEPHELQLLGCPEPIMQDASERHWQHPQLIFRYLKRRYATISHGVIAIPSISANTVTPSHLSMPFRIATENGDNPASGSHGLTLLPEGGFLDGVIL